MAQVKTSIGPMIENKDDKKMNRMVRGDDSSFYAYRMSNATGGAFYLEKYNKNSLTPVFSKKIIYPEGINDQVISIQYALGNVYIFKSHYNDNTELTNLYYQSVSAQGNIIETHANLITIKNVYIIYTISFNAALNRIFIKASYEPSEANDYISELYLFELKPALSKVWEKTMKSERPGKGSRERNLEETLIGMEDISDKAGPDMDKNYHFYFLFRNADKSEGLFYTYQLYILSGQLISEKMLQLEFDGNYLISSVKFSRTANNELIIGGMLKNIEGSRSNTGYFCYILNKKNDKFIAKTVKFLEEPVLLRIDPNIDNAPKYEYALDYMLNTGNDIYLVAQQYTKEYAEAPVLEEDPNHQQAGSPKFSKLHPTVPSPATTNTIKYHYRDILVVKFNNNGLYEWVSHIPYRNSFNAKILHHYKQYNAIATEQQLYIFHNEEPKNFDLYSKENFDLSLLKNLHDSGTPQFICSSLNSINGKIKNNFLFISSDYEKNILQEGSADDDFLTISGKNELILFTKNKGADQFVKLQLE
ncbi:MAG: hypothetical protein H7296_09630 [Bacteroidia bacterium]|nr:hypothetical protein [Bacteroidia bacterium]